MRIWLVILIGGLLTYGIRLSFILLWEKIKIPDLLLRSLRYVPPAVLSALIIPELFIQEEGITVSFENHRLIAGSIAIFIAWKFRNPLLTIISGMLILILLEMFL